MPGVLALAADIMTVVVGNPPLYTRLTQIRGQWPWRSIVSNRVRVRAHVVLRRRDVTELVNRD